MVAEVNKYSTTERKKYFLKNISRFFYKKNIGIQLYMNYNKKNVVYFPNDTGFESTMANISVMQFKLTFDLYYPYTVAFKAAILPYTNCT